MSIKRVFALFINDFNDCIKDKLFIKINFIFILFFSLPVFFFWPAGSSLSFFKPARLDVGVPLIYFIEIVFISILLTLDFFKFNNVISFQGWIKKNNLNKKEVFWGKLLSYWFLVLFLIFQTLPLYILFFFYGIFSLKTVLYFYGIGIMISFVFVSLGISGNFIKISVLNLSGTSTGTP